jgi:hypothetical protein
MRTLPTACLVEARRKALYIMLSVRDKAGSMAEIIVRIDEVLVERGDQDWEQRTPEEGMR